MDYNATEAGVDRSFSLSSSNDESPTSSDRVKKSRPHKNKKYPSHHRLKAKKGGANGSIYATSEFYTNARGVSMLALLCQYPYAGSPPAEISYGESSSPTTQVMMSGDGNYYA